MTKNKIKALHALALKTLKVSAAQREVVKAGVHSVDFFARITGTLVVDEDHEALVTGAIPWQRVAAVLFDKVNGVTMASVLREALAGDVDEDAVKIRAMRAMRRLKRRTKKVRKGKVVGDLVVAEVKS